MALRRSGPRAWRVSLRHGIMRFLKTQRSSLLLGKSNHTPRAFYRFRNRRARLLLMILSAATLLVISCTDGECVPFEGNQYKWDSLSEVRAGLPVDELRSRVGVPVSVTPIDRDTQDWRFFFRCKRTSWVGVGVAKIRSGGVTIHSEAVVRVRHRRVERVLKNTGWVYD